jgi:signal transduction histidine kinase/DNA-binding response OmpR family regulator
MEDQHFFREHHKMRRRTGAGWSLFILAFGVAASYFLIQLADRELRGELLVRAQHVARTIDVQKVRSLTGTEADLESPAYLGLKAQLAAARAVEPGCRFVFLMGRKADGTVFYYVDNEPPGSSDESPAGEIYEEVTPEELRVFDDAVSYVMGPFGNRWGTFVSAQVPVVDPQSGAVCALLGLDIYASDWRWKVAGRAALPVGLLWLLVIGMLTTVAVSARTSARPRPVLRRVMPGLTLIFLLLVGGGYWSLMGLRDVKQRQLSGQIQRAAIGDFSLLLGEQARGLEALSLAIVKDARTSAALRLGDGDLLLSDWQALSTVLRTDYGITHFYFWNAERESLARVYAPERRGGVNRRLTALRAESSLQVSSGLELGSVGTLTLRVVRPVIEESELLGYVELGKSIEDVFDAIVRSEGIEVILALRKDLLERTAWENGMALLGHQANWEMLPGYAIAYTSIPLPDRVDWLVQKIEGKSQGHVETDVLEEIRVGDRNWRIFLHPVVDVSGRAVGEMLLLHDVTEARATFRGMLLVTGIGTVVLLAALLGLMFAVLHRTDQGIVAQQAELRREKETLETIFSASSDTLMVMDDKCRVELVNPSGRMFLGGEPEYLLCGDALQCRNAGGAPGCGWTYACSLCALRPLALETLRSGVSVRQREGEIVRRREGREERIVVHISTDRLLLPQGQRVLVTLADITEQKLAEQAVQEANRQLALSSREALELAKQAEAASIAKGQFLANMSHELRTPMNAVLGFIPVLEKTRLDEKQRELIHHIQSGGMRLLDVINEVLDFSKIQAGKMSVACEDFDLRSMLDDFVAMISVQAHAKQLEMVLVVDADVGAVFCGDAGRIRQILTNLVGNAIKFTERGEVVLRVALDKSGAVQSSRWALPETEASRAMQGDVSESANEGDGAVVLRFVVADTGIGIPADRMGLLFQSFSQVDGSSTRPHGGTGLGLVISRELAHLMGGDISVSSVEGKGSEFVLTLPLTLRQQAASRSCAGEKTMKRTGWQMLPDKRRFGRILVVEDDRTNQLAAKLLLQDLGLKVGIASNGQAALDALAAGSYDLVFMDIQMPVMDGLEATRRIRGRELAADPNAAMQGESRAGMPGGEALPRIPIVALTAHAIQGDRERCLSAGMDDYLSKPIAVDALLAVLDKWLPVGSRSQHETAVEVGKDVEKQDEKEMGKEVDSAVWDRAGVLARMAGNAKAVEIIIEATFENMPHQIQELQGHLDAGDLESSVRLAHTIKGAAANAGAEALRTVALAIEKAGAIASMQSGMDELRMAFAAFKRAAEKG